MAIYPVARPHQRLEIFFDEIFHAMRKAPPQTYEQFFARIEEEFKRLGYREKISSGVQNILIVRLDAIGDMILTSGFIREVRKNFPQARITLVVDAGVYPVVELCPYVNEVLPFDTKIFTGNFLTVLEKIAVFCRDKLWQKKFSIAFSPRWHDDTFWHLVLMWLSGARERIGYGSYPFHSWKGAPHPQIAARDNFFLTKNIVTPKNIVADVEKNFYLLLAADLKFNQTHLELFYSAEDFQYAKDLLEDLPPNCKKVIVGIGARQDCRKYPVEKYLVALNELSKKNLMFIIVGWKDELDAAAYLEKNLPAGKVLNLVGKTTLRQTEAIISQSDFYVGNDTGNMHMAAAAQIPCLVLYRDAQDKEAYLPGIYSESQRFTPWQTNAVILRPDHQLDDCARRDPVYGWCHHDEPHCITQIPPQWIIDGFEVLEGV